MPVARRHIRSLGTCLYTCGERNEPTIADGSTAGASVVAVLRPSHSLEASLRVPVGVALLRPVSRPKERLPE